jgi:hypothetical protein
MKKINRRDFFEASLKAALFTAGASAMPFPFSLARGADSNDPHFFLNIIVPNGLDLSYLLDARPMELTTSGIKTNYLNEDPKEFLPGSGKTLVTRLFDPLLPYKDHFSIIQGVHMSPSFDGHEQNLNLLLTGNPFGGDFFLPHLNVGKAPLDGISNGKVISTINNDSRIVPVSSKSMAAIKKTLSTSTPLTRRSALFNALERNYLSSDFQGMGRMSQGAKALAQALKEQEPLFSDFATLPEIPSDTPETTAFVTSALELLKKGATSSINLILSPPSGLSFDTHAASSAKNSETLITSVVTRFAEVLRLLKETPYDSTRQFMDVTTFMLSTEFGRSNRQLTAPLSNSGTDHNPFSNSFILGGKGIAPNKVLGSSDLQSSTETLSGAHLQFDKEKLKVFGRPYDFKLQSSSTALPPLYNSSDYITVASVINTLYKSFGAPLNFYRKNGRDLNAAPVLDGILTT